MKIQTTLFLFLFLSASELVAQSILPDSANRIKWLKANAIKVSSIDPAKTDFSDLEKLKSWIRDAQVVSIGEPSHYVGTLLHAKTRLIKFLHQEMGFEIIAFEQGMYNMHMAWKQIQRGANPYKKYPEHHLLSIFEENLPLYHYVKSSFRSSHPLEIAGFDPQMGGIFYRDSLLKDLHGFFSRLGYDAKPLSDSNFIKEFFLSNNWKATGKTDLVLNELSSLLKSLDSLAPKPLDKEAGFYKQLLKSTLKNVECSALRRSMDFLSGAAYDRAGSLHLTIRDEQMAENLLWLVNQNPGRKIIVIAHNSHLVNDYPGDRALQRWVDNEEAGPAPKAVFDENYMGYVLADSLKEKLFNISFTIGEGTIGYIYTNDSSKTYTWKISRSKKKGVLENYLDDAGLPLAIVNIRNQAKGGDWLRKNIRVRYYTGPGSTYQWSKAANAIFYVRDATPVYVK